MCGRFESTTCSRADAINHRLQSILDAETDQWGIVDSVEIKHVDLPRECNAPWRGRRGRTRAALEVIAAEGGIKPHRLAEAADIMSQHPISLQLRFLQTLAEVATENNSTIVFPVPIDIIRPFMEAAGRADRADGSDPSDRRAAADSGVTRPAVQ
jgi:regulator of protease activity HflC (stomatin/prohibitin superfamily)